MNWFLLVGGLLLVGILIAVIYPLLKGQGGDARAATGQRELNLQILREQLRDLERDLQEGRLGEEAYRQSREDIERRTLDYAGEALPATAASGRKPLLAVAIAIAFPVVVGSLYWALGTPDSVAPGKVAQGAKEGEHALSQEQIMAMVERLALRLQENPNDGAGWLMLGRSYAVLGRYPESAAAFGRALSMLPPDAQHYADYADIVAMAQGKSLAGEPEKLVRRALEIDPNNLKALALSGTIAFDRQDYQRAIGEWRKVLALLPEGAGAAPGIQGSIRDAENRLAIAGQSAPPAAAKEAIAGAKVAGVVSIDPKLAATVKPDDTLFVYARAVNGPKMPVAMLRAKVSELPLRFTLDDSMAMAPQFKLSSVGQVVVGARVSRSGDALPRAGDIEGLSEAVNPGSDNLRIVIGSVVR